jgi:hypothetical protein
MVDLSHWDFAIEFSVKEVAALIVGIDPVSIPLKGDAYLLLSEPVLQRILHAETTAMMFVQKGQPCPPDSLKNNVTKRQETNPKADSWKTVVMELLLSGDDDYKIERSEISRWLKAINLQSVYQFELVGNSAGRAIQSNEEIDPSDLPAELDAANMAYRAIVNGYGDQTATPRNRLKDYLEKHYPDFNSEQVQRIATVANPDKTTGRMKRSRE